MPLWKRLAVAINWSVASIESIDVRPIGPGWPHRRWCHTRVGVLPRLYRLTDASERTATYSYRLQLSFRPHEDYLGDVRAIRRPATVIVGANDELFRAEAYAPLLEPIQPRLKVRMLPGLGHIDMVVDPAALREIVAAAV